MVEWNCSNQLKKLYVMAMATEMDGNINDDDDDEEEGG